MYSFLLNSCYSFEAGLNPAQALPVQMHTLYNCSDVDALDIAFATRAKIRSVCYLETLKCALNEKYDIIKDLQNLCDQLCSSEVLYEVASFLPLIHQLLGAENYSDDGLL